MTSIEKILVVDDELIIRDFLYQALKKKQKEVRLAHDGEEAIRLLQKESFDLVITDMKMPNRTGLDVLKEAKTLYPEICVVIITAYASVENAVEAMAMGAFHYLIKPFSLEAIEATLQKVEEHEALLRQNRYLKEEITHSRQIIAESNAMKKILRDVEKIAQSNASVFISGESGTGKEVIAQEIHNLSLRKQAPLIKVNCAALSDTLIESEFFGHEKGSFTGAMGKRLGRFELANKGTLLLDEITEIPLSLQPKLLRAIQEQEFERVGGTRTIHVDIRFIATSNRDLKQAIAENRFREDLFYRLNVLPIHIPPLRERKEEVLPLSRYFLRRFCRENHKKQKTLSHNAEQKLMQYDWPGNVRELGNILERSVVLSSSESVEAEDLHLEQKKESTLQESIPLQETTLDELEKKLILQTLENHNQNRTKSAEILGISVRTLRNKLKLYRSPSK